MITKSGQVAKNKKAFHDYFVFDKFEAGIVLKGMEVKALRGGKASISDAFVRFRNEEAFITNMHIPQYETAATHTAVYDPTRERKLLLHKKEIAKLVGKVSQKGFACIPLAVYFKNGRAKVEFALCQGKKKFDKRESIKKKIHKREMERSFKRSGKG